MKTNDEDKKLSKQLLNSLYGMTAQGPLKPDIEFNEGVYTTAWARLRLEEGIRLAGENLVYVDTDSVKK